MSQDLSAYIALAERLADAGGAIARRYFRTRVAIDDKADLSPVTIADREAEATMRDMIIKALPDHGVIGEEHGSHNAGASHVWVLDPIDGTRSFVTGRPMFGSLIALCRDGRPIVGVVDCPAMDERWIGAIGQPTRHRSRFGPENVARVRSCGAMSDATLYCTSPQMFDAAGFQRFESVRKATRLVLYGGDCYAYGLLASGFTDLVIEADLSGYDWAAIEPVIAGAGGSLTGWDGKPLDIMAPKSRVLAIGDQRLRDRTVALLTA
ncbi:MAG: histidinol phosphate phosphatase [Alphaproteobacteria bacterium]|nr:histidinol phosphate phosphatase [Alphaproteobacteria bacterium]